VPPFGDGKPFLRTAIVYARSHCMLRLYKIAREGKT
jgi:hypothetical protein